MVSISIPRLGKFSSVILRYKIFINLVSVLVTFFVAGTKYLTPTNLSKGRFTSVYTVEVLVLAFLAAWLKGSGRNVTHPKAARKQRGGRRLREGRHNFPGHAHRYLDLLTTAHLLTEHSAIVLP